MEHPPIVKRLSVSPTTNYIRIHAGRLFLTAFPFYRGRSIKVCERSGCAASYPCATNYPTRINKRARFETITRVIRLCSPPATDRQKMRRPSAGGT
jgi:hypothetical protein